MPAKANSSDLWLGAAKETVADLFKPQPLIYWADFLGFFVVGNICFALVRRVEPWWIQLACFLASCFAFYRAVLFTHELTHLRQGTFRTFRVVWNLLCGIPFLLPSYTYYVHLGHHRRGEYGTQRDAEYLPLASGPLWKILMYFLLSFLIPVCAILRFLVATPISWFVPTVRGWLDRHASSLAMDWTYVRPDPTPDERHIWRVQETACFGAARGQVRFSWARMRK